VPLICAGKLHINKHGMLLKHGTSLQLHDSDFHRKIHTTSTDWRTI